MESIKERNNLVVSYLTLGGLIIAVMMVFGILMLLSQGGLLNLSPANFYQFLTIHGTGMVGAAAFAAAGVMAYFLSKYVKLSKKIMKVNLVFF
ncbi:cytochrome c oxidase subunit 1 [Lentibacillus persicus]|uniref:Cytochrome c oxidase subunit 1 n=1 Tax=Lentibacillus persicus TaxID=640948 RepID=A0A1I1WN81_9BACI|nr:hypothetical protein [Lentibacillus persicus]SFD96596.1 cytochrome c oxidase subunit 1 [Lentibacillus persicus]